MTDPLVIEAHTSLIVVASQPSIPTGKMYNPRGFDNIICGSSGWWYAQPSTALHC